jgi:hypothetical protein
MKTKLHTYHFNCGVPSDAEAYLKLRDERMIPESRRPARTKFVSTGKDDGQAFTHLPILRSGDWHTTHEVELDLSHIFANQWNTAAADGERGKHGGYRIFDWVEYYSSHNVRRIWGHWLEVTDEMVKVRDETLACGYCGQHYGSWHESHLTAPRQFGFCKKCLNSPYLKENELYMLRLMPESFTGRHDAHPLTTEESEWLLPRYIESQMETMKAADEAKAEAARARLEKQREVDAMNYAGFDLLLRAGVNTDNVIFHDHVPEFKFGWRSPLSPSVADATKKKLDELSFPYPVRFETTSK